MVNPNGRRGAKFETDIVDYLRSKGKAAERLPKTGVKDQGDGYELMDNRFYTMWEAKNEKRINLPGYLKELEVERQHFMEARGLEPWQVHGIVIVKRRMASMGDCYVVQTVDSFFQIGG